MGKFIVNGAIDATSHITIKNGADLYLQAPASAPDDSGDLIFTKYDGTEQGRIWISGGIGMIRFSGSDSSKILIHSSNYNSYSPTLTGGGASGTWGINISGSAGYADGSNYTYRLAARGVTTNITTAPTVGSIVYDYNVLGDTTGLFPVWHNANAILTLNKHSGGYDSQLGFSSNGRLYYRSFSGSALDTATGWNTIAWTSDLSGYLPLSGGTLNGSLNVGGKVELWSDSEGGNIRLTSPNGSWWSIDALENSKLRFIWAEAQVPFSFSNDGTISGTYFTGTASYANNCDAVDGWHASGFLKKYGWWTNGDTSHHADTMEDGIVFAYTTHGVPSNWGTLCTFGYGNGRDYNLQLHGTGTNQLFFRNRSSDFGQGSWQRVQVVAGWGSTNPNSAGIRGTNTGDVYYVY